MFKCQHITIYLYCLCLFFNTLKAQSFDYDDGELFFRDYNYSFGSNTTHTSMQNFAKSTKIENTTNELLDPIILLNSSEQLKVSFDIINSNPNSYAYTFIHCDSEWEKSPIAQFEYLEGFFDNYIDNFEHSFNTITNYYHYEFTFPNENINFKKSGNYIVLVYDTEKNIPIITKRFMIYENLINIHVDVKKSTLARERDTKQEIDFYISEYANLNINEPQNELKIIIQKNDDWNDVIKNPKPSFISNKQLEYDYDTEISFLGGNEFREFDIKSLRYYGKNVKNIETKNTQGGNILHVDLYPDTLYNDTEYRFKYDLNGKYVLSIGDNKIKETEGDYALIKFKLKTKEIKEKTVYIYGELTNWDILKEAQMYYNDQEHYYYGFLYLKQGYYNYQYITQDKYKHTEILDGNYHETRNQYSIYIYHTPIWGDYDRLIGVRKTTSNSLN